LRLVAILTQQPQRVGNGVWGVVMLPVCHVGIGYRVETTV
jgi:hypothetical protein